MAKALSENARKLKLLRNRAGLSTRALGKLVGWVHTRVQYYEDEYKEELLPQAVVQALAPHLAGKGVPPVSEAELYALAGMAPPSAIQQSELPLVGRNGGRTGLLPASPLQARDPAHQGGPQTGSVVPLPPSRADMPRDVPVLGAIVGGEESLADFEFNGTIVDYVRRPPRLLGRPDVFATFVRGESMSPWREPGQLVYVEQARPPRAMDYVVIELHPPRDSNVRPALVKRLLAAGPTKLKLRQYTPAKDFEVDRRRVLNIFRVMDWDELMGF